MPRLLISKNVYRVLAALLGLVLLVFFADLHAGAQRKGRPANAQPQPGASGSTLSSATPQKKTIFPLRASDTSEGSRVTITSDVPLNDYSAYRSGDRFFLVIPQTDAPRLASALRGRGFDEVKVEKRGSDLILSFRLQPGTTARVDQKFNRLEIVFTTPGRASVGTTRNDNRPPVITPTNTNSSTVVGTGNQNGSIAPPSNDNATSVTTAGGTSARGGRAGGRRNRGSGSGEFSINRYPDIPVADESQATSTANVTPSPMASVSPAPTVSPSVAPSVTPTQQIAQTQTTQPAPPPAVTTTSNQTAPESRTLGATLRQNWLLVLLGALVLLIIGWVLTSRSRGVDRSSTTAAEGESGLKDAPATKTEAASLDAAAVAVPVATAAVVERASASESALAPEEVVSKEAEPAATGVDVERADVEVNNLLDGERYNESIVGASDTGTRQIIAAGLLAALAGRNEERRERAREAFIKHDYFDEATRDLRTAESSVDRASAARSLGLARDRAATPHLVAALEDSSPEVRRAAVEALADIRDPEALAPLKSLLEREKDRKVPRGLIRRAIETSSPVLETEETPAASATTAPAPAEETPTVEAPPIVTEAAVTPSLEQPASTEAEETTLETVRQPSVDTVESPSVETTPQPGALDTVPEPERLVAESSPTSTADVSSTESTSDLGALAGATPIILAGAGAAAAEEVAARRRAKQEARQREEEEKARLRAEEEARQRAEEERRRAEEAARQRAEEERQRAEAEAARQREEAEAARLRAEEEARQRAEEARLRAEEEARQRAEEERRRAEEESARKRAEEEARLRAEEEARRRTEEERRRAEEERQRAEAEARRREEEAAARLRAEEEARLRAEEEARKRAEEEARLRAEEEARVRAEEEARQLAEAEAARQRAQEEARLRAEEEARQRAEEERRRVEEEARRRAEEERQRAEAEAARQREEAEAARLRAEEEAERQRVQAELARLRAEAEATRLRSEEELGRRQVIEPEVAASLVDQSDVKGIVPVEESSVAPDSLIERNDGTASGWIEVDISEPEIVRHATPIKSTPAAPVEEKSIAQVQPEPIMVEPAVPETPAAYQQSVAPEAIASETGGQPRAADASKEIDQAVVDKGIAPVGEDLSTVPSVILKRLSSEDDNERATAVADLGRLGGDDSFREITAAFDDPSQEVRNAAARSLYNLQTDRAAAFTRALREAPPERRRAIGAALASSGLANEAVGHLMGESREKTYDAFSLLFLMSKAGEVQPLLRAIEDHPNNEVRLAVVKLLALSGQQEILPAFRRLAVRGSLPTEVRSAVMEAIYQISSQSSPDASSAA